MNSKILRLYNTYIDNRDNTKYIYIGMDDSDASLNYCFLSKENGYICSFTKNWLKDFSFLDVLNINYTEEKDQYIIEGYRSYWPNENALKCFKPILKDKLKNIINR